MVDHNNAMDCIASSLDKIALLLQGKSRLKTNPIDSVLPDIQELINNVKNTLMTSMFSKLQNPTIEMVTSQKTGIKKELYSKILVKGTTDKETVLKELDSAFTDKKVDASIVAATATKKGDVLVSFKETNQIDNIIKEIESCDNKIFKENIIPISPILPKLIITKIPQFFNLDNLEDVKTSLINCNSYLKAALDKDDSNLKLLFKYSTKRKTQSIVFKCSPDIRSLINLNKNELKLGSMIFSVHDHVHVKICSKCCKIGHLRKDCQSSFVKCTFCSKDHSFKDCPVKDDSSKYSCANCINNNSNHSCFSSQCPNVIKVKNTIMNRTNYVGNIGSSF